METAFTLKHKKAERYYLLQWNSKMKEYIMKTLLTVKMEVLNKFGGYMKTNSIHVGAIIS
jgi:hypothetical protein